MLRFSDTNTPQSVSGTDRHVVNNGLNLFALRKFDSALSIKVSIKAKEPPHAPSVNLTWKLVLPDCPATQRGQLQSAG